MSALFIDGFDKYGPPGMGGSATVYGVQPTLVTLLQQEWTVCGSTNMQIVSPLSATGGALSSGGNNNAYVKKTLAGNYSTLIVGMRFNCILTNKFGILFGDAGTYQCSVVVNAAGTISVYKGDITSGAGTLIATSTASVSAGSTHYLECQMSFGSSASYQVWLDGVSILSGTANTISTANSYANQVALGYTTTSTTFAIDDFYCFDTSGSTCNAPLLTSPHVETQFPTGDSQTQFTNNGSVFGQPTILFTNTSGTAVGANTMFLRSFTNSATQTLNSVTALPSTTSGSANFKAALFGAPPAVGAHRYWRVYINSVVLSQTPVINEIQFRTTAGTPLSFSGGTAAASSTTGAFVAANATDGNNATYWESASVGGGSWWSYDYGSGTTVSVAEVYMVNSTTYGATSFDLQYSDDNSTWTTVFQASPTVTSGVFAPSAQTFDVVSRPTTPGSPGSALIATGTAVTGCTAGTALNLPFASGQPLTAGASYAIGWYSDTAAVNFYTNDASASGVTFPQTYSSPVPAAVPGVVVTGAKSWMVYGNCTGASTNYESEAPPYPMGTPSSIYSSTVGNEDLYSFPALVTSSPVVYTMAVKGMVSKSDSGVRTFTLQTKSSSTDSAGTLAATAPATTFQWYDSMFSTDPNTSSAWTATGLNAAVSGLKVAS